MLIGTAGHIDHGKTTLIKALTGVDADRLPEEKARGITLDLGYAYTPLADGSVLGFIDVPGHEKLIHNMLAGATGIDFVLLVVAADDGPMPQTLEHLELVDLLGLEHGAVALTKCDRVDPGRLEAARREIAELLAGTRLAGSPVFPLSAITGDGVPALRAHIETTAAQLRARSASGRFRMAIDRSFTLAGVGTVVTGTVHAGKVSRGDTPVISPPGLKVRVRSLHVQDRPAESGQAGDRCALALTGDFQKQDVARGMWVVAPELHHPLTRFHAEIRVPNLTSATQPELEHWRAVHVHLAADDVTGRVALLDCDKVSPGGTALAEIILDREMLALRGDRFVLRDAGARRTVAGGRVLDIFPPTRHKRTPERLALLAAMRDDDPAATLATMAARSPAGVDLIRFAANWNLDDDAAAALWRRANLRVVHGAGFSADGWAALRARMLDALAREHERAPDMAGVERERLRRMTLATLPRAAFDALVEELLAESAMLQTRAWLHLPAHRASVSAADRDLFATLRPLLDAAPYNPPRVRDVFKATGTPEDTVRQLFRRVARAGELYPVAHDHYFTAQAVGELAGIVARLSARNDAVRAAEFRDAIYGDGGGGRKVAIQILEFFDRVGYTRRVRDDHVLRGESARHDWTIIT
jgi:selenocysteine-specific elongation factor